MTRTLNRHPIRVMLVDDSILIREGLKAILSRDTTMTVVGEAGTQAEALAAMHLSHPHVIVMDIRLADGSGIEACKRFRAARPDTSILFLATDDKDDNKERVRSAILAGAQGYLVKGTDGDTIVQAIKTLSSGQSILDSSIAEHLMTWIRQSSPHPNPTSPDRLSNHDEQVLFLISSGKATDEIAKVLNLKPTAVKSRLRKIYKQLNISRRAQAASYFARLDKDIPPQP